VRHRYARCRRSAGVEGHITPERNASEPERSHVRPQAAEPTGPHREGEKPKPMMHGHEKSDSAIVATKPPNKAGRPAAEAVERRAEAKENANRCRTCRTQCRESVSPAPERVRKAEASRQTSEVGAVCRKAARTVLCGGRPVMGVPTAIDAVAPPRAPGPRSRRLIQRERRLLEWPPSDPIGWSGGNCSAKPPRLGSVRSNSDQASKPLNIGRGTEGSNPAPSSGESSANRTSPRSRTARWS